MHDEGVRLMPKWYTVAEAAVLLGETKVRMPVAQGDLKSLKDGRSRRVLPRWVDEYIELRCAESEAIA